MNRNHTIMGGSRRLEARLTSLIQAPVTLVITDNTRSIISVRWKKPAYRVRLHHMFLEAGDSVLRDLASYISGKSMRPDPKLKAFIRENEDKIRRSSRPVRPRSVKIIGRGRHFDLEACFHRLNQRYFEGEADCLITWGNRRRRYAPKTVRLGSYSQQTHIIRINPILDRSIVPLYVVEDVIFHEMCHHHLGTQTGNGRRLHHHESFKTMENAFVHHEKAKQWLKKNLPRLIKP